MRKGVAALRKFRKGFLVHCFVLFCVVLVQDTLATAQEDSRVKVHFDAPSATIIVIDDRAYSTRIPATLSLVPGQVYHIRATSSGYLPWEQDVLITAETSEIFIDMSLAPGWQILFNYEEHHQNPEFGLYWENDSVIFRGSIGWPLYGAPDWSGLAPPTIVWYRYWPDEARLERFNISPYLINPRLPLETLNELYVSQWRDGFFDLVYPSPSGNRVIFPNNNTGTYWYGDLETHFTTDLEVPARSGSDFPI